MYLGSFRTFRPRHPLARIAMAVLGVIAVLVLVTLGLFAVAALAIGGGVFLLVSALRGTLRPAAPAQASPQQAQRARSGVIEGEYTVVESAPARGPGH
jgi:hypothetical protein